MIDNEKISSKSSMGVSGKMILYTLITIVALMKIHVLYAYLTPKTSLRTVTTTTVQG